MPNQMVHDGPSGLAAEGAIPGSPISSMAEPVRIWKLIPLWLIVAMIVAPAAIGAAVINAQMAVALKMDQALLGSGFGLFMAMMGISAPLAAIGFRFFGIRNVALAGIALAGSGALLLSTVVSSGQAFVIAYGLMMGLGVGIAGILPIQTVIAAWFVHRRALAVSVILSAVDVSGIVLSPTVAWLIDTTGTWRAGWWLVAGGFLVAAALTLWFIPGSLVLDPRTVEMGPDHARSRTSRVYKTAVPWSVGEAVKTRQFALLMLYNVGVGTIWVFFLAHGVTHMQGLGFSSATAASAVSIVVAASLAGNAAAGLLGDRIPPHLLGAVAMLLMGAGLLLGIAPSGFAALAVFAVVFGFARGASEVCLMTTLTNYFGVKPFPILFGIAFSSGGVASLATTAAAGWVYDQLHSFHPAMLFGAGFAVAIALLQLFASPKTIRRVNA